MLSPTTDRYDQHRHLKRNEGNSGADVSLRHRFVLELHLAGHLPTKNKPGKASIHELTDYSPAMIHRILALPDVQALRQQIMYYYDQEFEALFPDVIEAVRDGLVVEAGTTSRLDAARLWLKAHGRSTPSPSGGGNVNITAEDVVVQILNMANTRQEEVRSNG
jgi:hypothetical protein